LQTPLRTAQAALERRGGESVVGVPRVAALPGALLSEPPVRTAQRVRQGPRRGACGRRRWAAALQLRVIPDQIRRSRAPYLPNWTTESDLVGSGAPSTVSAIAVCWEPLAPIRTATPAACPGRTPRAPAPVTPPVRPR